MAARTAFLVRVTDAAEADVALAGGADRIGLSDARGALSTDAVAAIVRAIAGACPISGAPSVLAGSLDEASATTTLAEAGVDLLELPDTPDSAARFATLRARHPRRAAAIVLPPNGGTAALGHSAQTGFAAALLRATETRLTAQLGIEGLAAFVRAARRRGLEAWLEGALEPPDIPRMLALESDALAFRTALCRDGVRGAPLDPSRVAMVRQLIPWGLSNTEQTGTGAVARPASASATTADRVFVRDFIVEGGVGAYRSEHKAPQRMRFNVDAELAPIPSDVADMRDVFSYDIIIDAIRLATRRHVLLVERIALDVADATLRDPRVRKVRVRVEKLDILPGAVGVEIERTRA